MRAKELAAFIREREAVRVRKESGKPRPWTKDPILNRYRFCNIHREHDAVSRWLREWYYPFYEANTNDVWFAAIVARLLNNPDALYAVQKVIVPFQADEFVRILKERKRKGLKNFNPAYIVSTNGVAMDKVEYVAYRILAVVWEARNSMRPKDGDTLEVYHRMLMNFDGLGSFIAAQVVADLKYMRPLQDASDWHRFAAPGPGSRRGLNRVMGFPLDKRLPDAGWLAHLNDLAASKFIKPFGLHAQDLQNCLCEFDKYERARLGEGTPKQIYKESE